MDSALQTKDWYPFIIDRYSGLPSPGNSIEVYVNITVFVILTDV